MWRIDRDGSRSELIEFVLLLASAALFLWQSVASRRALHIVYAPIAAYMALDGYLLIHERAAEVLLPGRHQSGELIYRLSVGSVIVALVANSYYRAADADKRAILAICCALAVLGGAAVGIALHAATSRLWPTSYDAMGLLEDAVELLGITLLFAVALRGLRAPGQGGSSRPEPRE